MLTAGCMILLNTPSFLLTLPGFWQDSWSEYFDEELEDKDDSIQIGSSRSWF